MHTRGLRVLLVDTSAARAASIRGLLEEVAPELRLTFIAELALAAEVLDASVYDIVFVNPDLPDARSLGAIAQLVAATPAPVVALLHESAAGSGESVLALGAADYLFLDQLDARSVARVLHVARLRQRAQRELRLQKRVLERDAGAVVATDRIGRVRVWNVAAARLYGWTDQEPYGRCLLDVTAQAQPDASSEAARRILREGGSWSGTAWHRRREGATFHAHVDHEAVTDERDRIIGMLMIVRVDAARQHDPGAAAPAQGRDTRALQALIEAAPMAIIARSTDDRVTAWNAAAERIFGWRAEEVLGRPVPFLPDRERAGAEGPPMPGAETPAVVRTQRCTKDGRVLAVSVTTAPIFGPRGELEGLLDLVDDLTSRRHLEEQLLQSQKMDAVGRLAGGVAHDFNNLLTAVAGHTQMLLEQIRAPEQRDELEQVMLAVQRAASLTKQLLALSRRQVLQPRVMCVNDLIRDLSGLLSRASGPAVELRTRLDTNVLPVRADRAQLEQVLLNLVVNAREAMPSGGVAEVSTSDVTIGEGAEDSFGGIPPGRYTAIAVRDTGEGMDDAVMARIFEPFFTTREYGAGAGLGLPTVYGIITQSGGRIRVSSRPGGGSAFEVLLPALAEPAAAPAEAEPLGSAAGQATILLVEDEPAIRRLGVRILERFGYTVLEAASGAQALDLFEARGSEIALMVTDVVMPGMNGPELARRIHQVRPSLPVLFVSGYTADAISRQGGLPAGTEFLEKPFTPDALVARVSEMLERTPDAS